MLTIRLRRMGKRDQAFYRFVVSDSRKTPTASAVEEVGHYDPLHKEIQLDRERIDYWVGNGAILSNSVKTLIRRSDHGLLAKPGSAAEAKTAAPEKEATPKEAATPKEETPKEAAPKEKAEDTAKKDAKKADTEAEEKKAEEKKAAEGESAKEDAESA